MNAHELVDVLTNALPEEVDSHEAILALAVMLGSAISMQPQRQQFHYLSEALTHLISAAQP